MNFDPISKYLNINFDNFVLSVHLHLLKAYAEIKT
jgi:hypothetical protein